MSKRKNNRLGKAGITFYTYATERIREKRLAGKHNTADLYRTTRNWICAFLGRRNLLFPEITPGLISRFVAYLQSAGLRVNTVYGEEIVYRRKKTGTLIRVGITAGMRRLINKYADASSPYLFPILSPGREVGHEEYKAILRSYNNSLKKIGRALSRPIHLTSYVFRHTWAVRIESCER